MTVQKHSTRWGVERLNHFPSIWLPFAPQLPSTNMTKWGFRCADEKIWGFRQCHPNAQVELGNVAGGEFERLWYVVVVDQDLWYSKRDLISIHITISIDQLVWCPNQEIQEIWPYNIHMEITAFSWHIHHQWSYRYSYILSFREWQLCYRQSSENHSISEWFMILEVFFGYNEWDKTCPCRAWKDATGSGSKKHRWSTASGSACLAERYVESSVGDSFLSFPWFLGSPFPKCRGCYPVGASAAACGGRLGSNAAADKVEHH